MARVFISYRRDDSRTIAGWIHERLAQDFDVFRDVDIPLGVSFPAYIDRQIALCDVLLAIIGPDWLDIRDNQGNRRLDNPSDWVRLEIESALRQRLIVMPVLVHGAAMPAQVQMPSSLAPITTINAAEVHEDRSFHRDMDGLIRHLKRRIHERSTLQRRQLVQGCLGWRRMAGIAALMSIVIAAVVFSLTLVLNSRENDGKAPVAEMSQATNTSPPTNHEAATLVKTPIPTDTPSRKPSEVPTDPPTLILTETPDPRDTDDARTATGETVHITGQTATAQWASNASTAQCYVQNLSANDINVRWRPEVYPGSISALLEYKETAPVTGKSVQSDGLWWQILKTPFYSNSKALLMWVKADVVVTTGDCDNVPIVEP